MSYLLVLLGGMAGGACRLLVSRAVQTLSSDFPYGTLAVNWSGSFLVGIASGGAARSVLSPELSALLIAGFLGAYTTFSTLSYETLQLFTQGMRLQAVLNLALSAGGAVLLVLLGGMIG